MIKKNDVVSNINIEEVINSNDSKSKKMIILFNNGYDIKYISELMNVRYNFVYNVIKNESLKGNIDNISKEKKESKKDKIIELYLKGKSKIEICECLKCSYNEVWNYINKYNKK